MKLKGKAGFTIIELMFAMIGMAVIAITVGSMLVYGWMGWRRSTESVAMQQNAKVAMRIIEQGIRNGKSSDITWDADGIYFTKADDIDFSTTEFTAGSMVQVDAFNVSTNGAGGVDVTFSLSTVSGNDENTYQMTVYPRN